MILLHPRPDPGFRFGPRGHARPTQDSRLWTPVPFPIPFCARSGIRRVPVQHTARATPQGEWGESAQPVWSTQRKDHVPCPSRVTPCPCRLKRPARTTVGPSSTSSWFPAMRTSTIPRSARGSSGAGWSTSACALGSSLSRIGARRRISRSSANRRLFFGITAGNLDSQLARLTVMRRPRREDHYTPGGGDRQAPRHGHRRLLPAPARSLQARLPAAGHRRRRSQPAPA